MCWILQIRSFGNMLATPLKQCLGMLKGTRMQGTTWWKLEPGSITQMETSDLQTWKILGDICTGVMPSADLWTQHMDSLKTRPTWKFGQTDVCILLQEDIVAIFSMNLFSRVLKHVPYECFFSLWYFEDFFTSKICYKITWSMLCLETVCTYSLSYELDL